MRNSADSWDCRIVTAPIKIFGFTVGHKQEAHIILRIEGRLVMLGMCNKGFGFLLDNRQYAGEATLNDLEQQTFRIDSKGSIDRLMYAIGRKDIDTQKLDGAKAIAYVFGLPDWKEATPQTLIAHAV